MKKRKLASLFALALLASQVVSPFKVFAATTDETAPPSGQKQFAPVGIDKDTNTWKDGVALGGTYLTYDEDGIIYGFATDATDNVPWNGQKFKNVTDNELAYCLNFNLASPDGSSNVGGPISLTADQQKKLSNLLKLGYMEQDGKVYKGPGVATLSNIDAFTATQWMVHQIVPTYDMSKFEITNPQLKAATDNMSQWINNDLDIRFRNDSDTSLPALPNDGKLTDENGYYHQSFQLYPGIEGKATVTLSKDIEGATVTHDGTTQSISSSQGLDLTIDPSVNDDYFTINIPDSTPTDSIDVVANGGTVTYSFAVYDAPAAGQQNVLVPGGQYISDNQKASVPMTWDTPVEPQPELSTTATDENDGDHYLDALNPVHLVDKVEYTNLVPGKEYTVNGTLMDKETNDVLKVNGKTVTASKTFTPESANGYVNVEFTFDASGLAGHSIVVFESLLNDGKEVASHADINAEGQTVTVKPVTPPTTPPTTPPSTPKVPEAKTPTIGTTATNKADGSHTLPANQVVSIKDAVAYQNLTPGKAYQLTGYLMDKTTGKEVLVKGKTVDGKTNFTPTKANGTVDVEFTFDTTGLANHDIVVFETLKDSNGKVVAEHKDINAASQTDHVASPVSSVAPVQGTSTPAASLPNTGDANTKLSLSILGAVSVIAALGVASYSFYLKRKED